MIPLLFAAIMVLLFSGMGLWTLKRLILLAAPDELLVIVGRQPGPHAPARRLTRGGRAVRIPLLERAFRFDLTAIELPLEARARCMTMLSVTVAGAARVRMAHEPPAVDRALRRLGGLTRAQVAALAAQIIEGELTAIVATHTPEELHDQRDAVAERLVAAAEPALDLLGLELDHLTLTGVADEVGYLDAVETIARLSA